MAVIHPKNSDSSISTTFGVELGAMCAIVIQAIMVVVIPRDWNPWNRD